MSAYLLTTIYFLNVLFRLIWLNVATLVETTDVADRLFPPGPFVIPISSDGCPGDRDDGWHASYINMTASISFDQSSKYSPSCGKGFSGLSSSARFVTKSRNVSSNLLLTFDNYTLNWNFCYKTSNDEDEINPMPSWPPGNYSVYGTADGCPLGFTAYNMTSCFPPLLRHIRDGYLPYYTYQETLYSTIFTFLLCKRSTGDISSQDHVNGAFRSNFPFVLIQDPVLKQCDTIEGFDVTDDVTPGPIYSIVPGLDEVFPLTYCYYVNRKVEEARLAYNLTAGWETEGFFGMGTAYLHSSILVPSAEMSLLGLQNSVESWMMIDARETRLVSAILFQTHAFETEAILHEDINASVSRIYVGDEQWSFLHGGALRCLFSLLKKNIKWNWFIFSDQELYSCWRSQYGRYVTLIFSSNKALGGHTVYKDTFILILTNEEELRETEICNEELGMENYDILDNQLTASTWQASFPPSQARPHLSGWCADAEDDRPFIQVNLAHVFTLNGIVITDWYKTREVRVNNTLSMTIDRKGTYSFELEVGTALSSMIMHGTKPFVVDISQHMEVPQTYLFNEPLQAKHLRIYPTPFTKSSAPCIRFELLGCRISEIREFEKYGTRVDESWSIYFDVPYIPINNPQEITSFGYPSSYSHNQFYKWNITLETGYAFLQFVDISLRVYEGQPFQNNIGCRDTIMVSGYDLRNPLTFIREYYEYVSVHINPLTGLNRMRLLLNSDDNGRIIGVPQTSKYRNSLFLGLLACSEGPLITKGRGFRVHVVKSEFPFCWSDEPMNTFCFSPSMELVSPKFIGMYDLDDRYTFVVESDELLLLMIKILDFDISCHADSKFYLVAEPKNIPYCNKDVIYEEQFFIMGLFRIIYTKILVEGCENAIFPEGFQLMYKMAPRTITPVKVMNGSQGFIKKQVCSEEFGKCYDMEFIFDDMSWTDSAQTCRDQNMSLVTIHTANELSYIRQLTIDIYSDNLKNMFYDLYGRLDIVNSFIGLRRYKDTAGVYHEHWIDGTPLTYTAWDDNEPSETFIKLCSIMRLIPSTLQKENTLLTVSCEQKLFHTLLICEKRTDPFIPEHKKITVHFEECYKSKSWRYKGNLSVTHNGIQCQEWDSQFPHAHEFSNPARFPDKTIADAENFCRSPDRQYTPWCFTKDPLVPWEYCPIHSCSKVSAPQKDLVTLFRCNSGEWMSYTVKCNGYIECLDSSDETNCTDERFCKDDEFTCDNGRCIHVHQICDFKPDCADLSDEFCEFPICNIESEFRCTSGQCISNEKRCDSFKNCVDGTDEEFCDTCNTDRAFQCGDRSCISKRLVCDTYVDCIDGADEASCEHIYQTCDDVLLDGLREDGIYLIGVESRRTRCKFNETSGKILMEFLNVDWANRGNNVYRVDIPGTEIMDIAADNGYRCSQQYDEVPQRERQRTMMIENMTTPVRQHRYTFGMTTFYNGPGQSNFTVLNNLLRVKGHFNSVESRILINNLQCSKEFKTWNKSIHCSKGKVSDPDKRCLYEFDDNSIITGCRTLTHLQNCENVPCPPNYFKCTDSYCIPMKNVCNGRIDCRDGQDEQYCECEGHARRDIIIVTESTDFLPYNRATLLFETATRLGGTLYSKYSTIRTLQIRLSTADSKYVFESSTINSYSEHPSQIFEKFYENETDDNFHGTSEQEQTAIIWLSDVSDYTEREKYTFNLFGMSNTSGQPSKYRIVIGHGAYKAADVDDVTQLIIEDYEILGTLGKALFPSICKGQPLQCKDRYRCSLSMVCIPHEQVCDGKQHCPYGDDEELCEFICPELCKCKPGIVTCTNIHNNNQTILVPVLSRILDLSNTTHHGADILRKQNRKGLSLLISLNVSRCEIRELSKSSFQQFTNLLKLDISFNKFTILSRDTFIYLHHLKELYMSGNTMLRVVEPGAFNSLSIESLSINKAQIERLDAYTFAGLTLQSLHLASNKITYIDDLTFSGLTCQNLNIEDNPVSVFTKRMFDGVNGVKKLVTSAYKFCCIRPGYLNEENCLPYKDEFSSCTHLMRNTTLQGLMWTIGLLALTGNVLSIVYRLIYDRNRLKLGYGIFVTNLAISDLLMGIYMLIIATADKLFMDRYIEIDEYWRNSGWCQFAGVLSTLSSEASVLFMCLITIDRVIVIKFPFGQYRLSTYTSLLAASVAWVIAVLIALVPVLYTDYFNNKFYSKSGVCLALPLTRDRPPGWLYSVIVYIGFNLITFGLITVGQLLIYIEVHKHNQSKKRLNMSRSNELKVARNLLLLVATDFMCWFPVGLMGLLALSGHVIPGEMYAWTAVLILPINSALNPFMYTFSAIISAKKIAHSTKEASHTDEGGKVIMDVLPYFIQRRLRSSRPNSLDKVLDRKRFSIKEIAFIVHNVVSYIEIVHEHGLVLDGQVSVENIDVPLTSDLKISGKATIMSLPSVLSTRVKKGGHAYDDIYDVGKLTEVMLRNVYAYRLK